MADSNGTTLVAAEPSDELLLSNLLELYIHDLSAAFPHIALGADGRYGYPYLPLYFSERERRFAFLLHHDVKLAGFALVTRGSPLSEDPNVYDIAEFFVLRRYRGSGVGRQAALLLWNQLPGKWMVRVSEANPSALSFWSKVVAEFTNHTARQSTHPGRSAPWQAFEFDSPAAK